VSNLQRFVVEEGDWEIVLRPNGGYDKLAANTLEKHGTHDQSTHNPHKGGGRTIAPYDPMNGYRAGEWTRVTDPAEAERLYVAQSEYAYQQREGKVLEGADRKIMEDNLSNPYVTAVRRRELEGAEVWKNGSTLLIAKRNDGSSLTDPRGIVTDAEIQSFRVEIDRMQRDYPVAGLRVHIDNSEFDRLEKGDKYAAFAYRGGASSKAEPHIWFRTKSMRGLDRSKYDRSTYFSPDGERLNQRRVTLTHEWGHIVDAKGGMPYELKDLQIKGVIDRVDKGFALQSVYGSTDPAEHFAESFASFVIHKQKGWKMTNPLTLEMAKEFKW
jgi:hypothetical protein